MLAYAAGIRIAGTGPARYIVKDEIQPARQPVFPPVPRDAGVTGSYCPLCNTLNGYATFGELLAGATLLTLLGGGAYLLGKVD